MKYDNHWLVGNIDAFLALIDVGYRSIYFSVRNSDYYLLKEGVIYSLNKKDDQLLKANRELIFIDGDFKQSDVLPECNCDREFFMSIDHKFVAKFQHGGHPVKAMKKLKNDYGKGKGYEWPIKCQYALYRHRLEQMGVVSFNELTDDLKMVATQEVAIACGCSREDAVSVIEDLDIKFTGTGEIVVG